MDAITIPKAFSKNRGLVIIPPEEYEKLAALKGIREFCPTPAQRKAWKKSGAKPEERKDTLI